MSPSSPDPRGDSVRAAYPLFHGGGGGSIPTSPLQLNIGAIEPQKAIALNKCWHSRLPFIELGNVLRHRHSVSYGAEFDGVIYAIAIWSSPSGANRMKDGLKMLELRRMAISDDAPKNTASRMLKVMRLDIHRRFPELIRLISYQDTEVHTGTIYKAAGWRIGASQSTYQTWDTPKRPHLNKIQSAAPKVRWEYDL